MNLNQNLVECSVHHSKISPVPVEQVLDTLHMQLVASIVKTKVNKTVHDYHVEYRASLLVFSPDEFWRIVDEEAKKQNSRYPSLFSSNSVL